MSSQGSGIENREEQVVVFQLLDQTYGIDIASVYEIIRAEAITQIPRAPHFVEGVINLRGHIIPVIDLCKRFNLPPRQDTRQSRIIVVDVAGTTVGMIVDAVQEVLRFPASSIEPPPPVAHGVDAAYLRGIALNDNRLIILLDLDKILYENEMQELGQADFNSSAAI